MINPAINAVYYEQEGIEKLNDYIKNNKLSKIVFLVDENTHEYCFPLIINILKSELPMEILEIEMGEENKNIYTCINLWEALTELFVDRKGLIINIGGGVLTDMGGFIAHTYKRGIPFINFPTTLLAMVDASVGGKTGVDLSAYKNLIGNFALPEMVVIFSEFLNTLPENQIRSGYAEIIKHALIADKEYWREITESGDNERSNNELSIARISNLIKRSVEIKSSIVSEDFTENAKRKILNFGHTIGHAIESYFLKNCVTNILHGEGVAAGMIMESYLSMKKGMLSEKEFIQIQEYIDKVFERFQITKDMFEEIFVFMCNDKKNINNELKFVLLEKIGKAVYDISVEKELVEEALLFYTENK